MLLTATGICKAYGELEILKEVDVQIDTGQMVSITGASGAGKSTLLHVLGALDTPDKGEVQINDVAIHTLGEKEMATIRNQQMGFVFQFHNLLPEFTALENVMMPGMFAKRNQKELTERGKQLLDKLGVVHRAEHKPSELSGGEQQRVAIARALINDPKLVLADEPSGNLDSKNAETLHQLLLELTNEERAVVVVTHNEDLAKLAHRNIKLQDGKIVG
ncbi:MAG: ABC transporter ATP-binding protein [Cyclobacteriaceae bacterium]